MTNTLHRFGDAASFHDDFIVFAICSRGKNDHGAVENSASSSGSPSPSNPSISATHATAALSAPARP